MNGFGSKGDLSLTGKLLSSLLAELSNIPDGKGDDVAEDNRSNEIRPFFIHCSTPVSSARVCRARANQSRSLDPKTTEKKVIAVTVSTDMVAPC